MKIFLALLFFSISFVLPQYSKEDFELIKTTSTREFNKEIIFKYLKSNISQKINSALLSISHSEDTSFVDEVISLNFDVHYEYICFALGQLGNCKKSTDFLFHKIQKPFKEKVTKLCIETIGKTGNSSDFDSMISLFCKSKIKFPGISKMIANFYFRGIKNSKSTEILIDELNSKIIERKIDAVYSLYRTGESNKAKNILTAFLTTEISQKNYSEQFIQYSLGCFRRAKSFPEDFNLAKKILAHSNWLIRCEGVKSIVYYKFKNAVEFNLLLECLSDKNPNVARQTAMSLKEIKVDTSLSEIFQNSIDEFLYRKNLNANVRGELAISYLKLFPPQEKNFHKKLENKIQPYFLYQIARENYKLIDYPFGYFLAKYKVSSAKDKSLLIDCILKLENDFDSLSSYNNFVIEQFRLDDIEILSSIIENTSTKFIKKHTTLLKEIILFHLETKVHQPNYGEFLQSLIPFSLKIDSIFYVDVLNQLSNSKIYSIKKLALQKIQNLERKLIKTDFDLSELWNYAFKYKSAIIKTNKGNFEIEFTPQIAPISVGNFCSLTDKNSFIYNKFHRVVPAFVIQGGDPTNSGYGCPGYEIISEFSPYTYKTGIVGMASNGKDTEGSQWFVTTASYPHLDGRYTIFGKIKSGLNIVSTIDQDDEVIAIELKP